MDFESRVWDFDGGDRETVRSVHLGYRQGCSKKGGGGLKVLISHYVPQSNGNGAWGGCVFDLCVETFGDRSIDKPVTGPW